MTRQRKARTTEKDERQETTRQKIGKPLKLGVDTVKAALEKKLGKEIKLKWVKYDSLPYQQTIGWSVVSSDMKQSTNQYTPDGRLIAHSEGVQSAEAGAYTADVGNGEKNFLMYKDLEAYEKEDLVWVKEEAARPMDSIQNATVMGEDAGLNADKLRAYQPKQQVEIEKKRSEY